MFGTRKTRREKAFRTALVFSGAAVGGTIHGFRGAAVGAGAGYGAYRGIKHGRKVHHAH